MGFESPQAVVIELVTFTENNGDIYRSQTEPILRNLATKKARGDYDHEKAVQAFMYLAETGAKKYAATFGGGGSPWHEMFPMDIRRLAAEHWRNDFEDQYAQGEYASLLPKKYQAKPTTARKPRGKSAKAQPNPAQAGALLLFADHYGPARWKEKLSDCWMRGGYPSIYGVESAYLQQVRNQLGPSWLDKITLAELKQIAQLPSGEWTD